MCQEQEQYAAMKAHKMPVTVTAASDRLSCALRFNMVLVLILGYINGHQLVKSSFDVWSMI
ncbi:hypothetical protein O9993_19360 [Vibrio lentus]|nr:hypothetical protein [Vibrio lentus]